jgi:predicted Zn-dependent protease
MDCLEEVIKIPARFVDLMVSQTVVNSITMKDGVVKEVTAGEIEGVGLRILENTWGFASANSLEKLEGGAERAYSGAKEGEKIAYDEGDAVVDNVYVKAKIDPRDIGFEEKKELLRDAFGATKDYKEPVSSTFT